MAKWLAGMLGRYFNSQSGDIFVMPSLPQRANWNCPCGVKALQDAFGELFWNREHVVGAEGDSRAVGIDLPAGDARIGQRQLGGGHAHLALATHHLQTLADRLLLLLFEGAEVVDFAGELPGFRSDADRHGLGGRARKGPTPLCPCDSPSHRASLLFPKGLISPIPVITTRRAVDVMHCPLRSILSEICVGVFYCVLHGSWNEGDQREPGFKGQNGRTVPRSMQGPIKTRLFHVLLLSRDTRFRLPRAWDPSWSHAALISIGPWVAVI